MVYGGGAVGLMGLAADAALEAGGRVVGVIPGALFRREVAHAGLTELQVVGSMHERKAQMAELSDAFLALPGGLGTYDELLEILTWAQLGAHGKPVGAIDVEGYFGPLIALIDHGIAEGFIREGHRRLLQVGVSASSVLDACAAYVPAPAPKWIGLEAT